jgi:hypothetical protein
MSRRARAYEQARAMKRAETYMGPEQDEDEGEGNASDACPACGHHDHHHGPACSRCGFAFVPEACADLQEVRP